MASVEAKSRRFSFSSHRTVDEDHRRASRAPSFIPSSSKSGSEESPGDGIPSNDLAANTKWWFNQQHKVNSSGSFWNPQWETFPTPMQNDDSVRIPELEALQKKPTLPEAFDRYKHIVSDEPEKLLSELESRWIGIKKNEPWWRTADLDDFVSQKSLEHFDNCDLPLPHTNKTKRFVFDLVNHDCSTTQSNETEKNLETPNSELSKAQLLEALCHSQRRAREAETAAQQASNEKEHVIALFLRQASQIFAYKQWLYILQLETLCLQLRHSNYQLPFYTRFPDIAPWFPTKVKLPKRVHKATNRKVESVGIFLWGLALVGAGVLLGWTMGWLFPAF